MTAKQSIRVRKRRVVEDTPNLKALQKIEKNARIKKARKK